MATSIPQPANIQPPAGTSPADKSGDRGTAEHEALAAHLLAAPDYVEELGDGLVRRWSTAADEERIGICLATVFRAKAADPLNQGMINRMAIMFRGGFPLMGSDDFAVVEDRSRPQRPIVACACLWRHTWSYAGIPFGVGRPEYVATLLEYRNRGLMRRVFELLHARSAARGDRAQAITGIPYYYRLFGYEYALDLGGRRKVPVAAIPPLKEGESEAYHLREARAEDAGHMLALYNQRRSTSLVWSEMTEDLWRYYAGAWELPVVQAQAPEECGLERRQYMIVDGAGEVCGLIGLPTTRRRRTMHVGGWLMAPDVNWYAAAPSVLRGLVALAAEVPLVRQPGEEPPPAATAAAGSATAGVDKPESAAIGPLAELSLDLGRSHPAYDVLGESIAAYYEPPYAWYIRVADVAGFVRHIAPVLEERLARSPLAGFTGEYKIDLYRDGLRLEFAGGKLAAAEPWREVMYGYEGKAALPPLVFLQLLFGHRSLGELKAIYPDVYSEPDAPPLLEVLFPKQGSWVWSASYT
jgi:hypothetical protein